MRNKFFIWIIAVCCLFLGGSASQAIFADTSTLVDIDSKVYLGENKETEISETQNGYEINFVNEQTPYDKVYLEIILTTSPDNYETMTDIEKQQVYSQLVWTLNGTPFTFPGGAYQTENITLVQDKESAIVTITKPGVYEIVVSDSNNLSTTCNIVAKYTEPTGINLGIGENVYQNNQQIDLLYEEIEPFTINALLSPKEFISPTKQYTFVWYKNGVELTNQTSSELQIITLNIGTTTIACDIVGTTISTSISFVVTTNENLNITLTTTGGPLVQTLGDLESCTPITFSASLPVLEDYSVEWFIKKPNTSKYTKLNEQTNLYTFRPMIDYQATGEYKVLARAILESGNVIEAIPVSIVLKAKVLENNEVFNITYTTKENSSTGLESYEMTIDVGEYFDESRIVWYVGTSPMKMGKDFYFAPVVANQYIVTVKLLSEDGSNVERVLSNTLSLQPKSIDGSNMLTILLIAGAVLIVICTLSIIISNKGREKIW
ncbi:MAG: hypothetical protein IJA69_00080 [Clostridia bacterium]|nr:hypothetical protein [Clostridia bacterium]